jgi:antitoxin VapB
MEKGTVFQTNRSQAIRLPKAVALPSDVRQVDIVAVGRIRVITPAGESWDEWFDNYKVTPGFMNDREQPEMQAREAF